MGRLRTSKPEIKKDEMARLSQSLILALVSAVIIIIFSFGVYRYNENNLSPAEKVARLQANKSLTPAQVQSTISTPEVATSVNSAIIPVVPPTAEERNSLQVKIVNGTGLVNGADQVAQKLGQIGYKIGSVEMGQLYSNLAATIRYSKGSEKMALEMNSMFNNQADMQVGEELINYIVIILGKSFK